MAGDLKQDWWVPGGAVITDDGHKLRLRPPADWKRLVLTVGRVPPSMNTNELRSNWRGFQKQKKEWQEEVELDLMVEKVKRRGYKRALVGAILRFPKRASRRDTSNYRGMIDKACGDALTSYGAIPDDDEPHYYFGGVEFVSEVGPAETTIVIFLQPND